MNETIYYCSGGAMLFTLAAAVMPGSVRKSILASAIRYGIVSHPDSTGSVYGRTLKEIKATLLR